MDISAQIETLESNLIMGLISDKEYDDELNALIADGNRINHYRETEEDTCNRIFLKHYVW